MLIKNAQLLPALYSIALVSNTSCHPPRKLHNKKTPKTTPLDFRKCYSTDSNQYMHFPLFLKCLALAFNMPSYNWGNNSICGILNIWLTPEDNLDQVADGSSAIQELIYQNRLQHLFKSEKPKNLQIGPALPITASNRTANKNSEEPELSVLRLS